MDVSPERLVEQANERFQLQDYYGAIHLLEEVIATGRAFADAHHLLGLSYSLVGQQDQALAQLDRALQLNPQYVEALIHKAIVLNELGREYEADASLRRHAGPGVFPRGRRAGREGGGGGWRRARAGGPRGGGVSRDAGSERPRAARRRHGARRGSAGARGAGRAGGARARGQEEEAVRSAIVGLALLVAAGCTRSAADHEELGDRAYAAGAYRDALAEYQLGLKAQPGNADLQAKAAAAALHTGDYVIAVAAYPALAQPDRSRAGEAADGLERVARAALAANDRAAVVSALAALRPLAPARPLGRYARLAALDATNRGDSAAALAILPSAVATVGDPGTADSLLYLYGMAAARARDCTTAVAAFEGVIRRQRAPAVQDAAREGISLCALIEGQRLLEARKPADAESWVR